ncbi:MAG: translation initiation factor IF-6 [Euryarchaeota archaeon]|nr:translation initiation factor IF-6 [Euryarchaeota archaeon]
MIAKLTIFGSPYVGVYIVANEKIAVVPVGIDKKEKDRIAKTLGVEVFETVLGGSHLIGSLAVMNSNGAIITNFAEEGEVRFLMDKMNVLFIDDKINAVGNDILANDHAALVHLDFDKKTVKLIEDALDVEVVRGQIGGIKTVGSAAVVTNKGMLVHPDVEESEIDFLKKLFKVPVYLTTANYGSKYVGAGVVANTKGALVGENCSNVEIDRIENGLDLIS